MTEHPYWPRFSGCHGDTWVDKLKCSGGDDGMHLKLGCSWKGGQALRPTQLALISEDLIPLVNDSPLDVVEIILIACEQPFTNFYKCHSVLGLYCNISESLWDSPHVRLLYKYGNFGFSVPWYTWDHRQACGRGKHRYWVCPDPDVLALVLGLPASRALRKRNVCCLSTNWVA